MMMKMRVMIMMRVKIDTMFYSKIGMMVVNKVKSVKALGRVFSWV